MNTRPWYAEEMAGAVLPDARFADNVGRLVGRLARQPGGSFSRMVGSDGRQSIRRLGRRVDENYGDLLVGHFGQTAQRCRAYPCVLCLQDTTSGNYRGHRAKDLGPIDDQPEGNGLLAHTGLMVTTRGVPLGLSHLDLWVRDPAAHGQAAERRERLPEEKESKRWRETAEAVQELLPEGPEVIVVEDREGDNFHFLSVPRRPGCHLLCRMTHPRRVLVPGEEAPRKLTEVARAAPAVGRMKVQVSEQRDRRGRVTRRARRATVQVAVQEVTVLAPQRRGLSREPVRVWVIRVWEPEPPAGERALEWILVSTKPADRAKAALRLVYFYSLRWRIERLHYVLKSGLRIEEWQLRGRGVLLCALALAWVAAWRILWLTHFARAEPGAPASACFSAEELRVLGVATGRAVGTAREAALALAQLGGAERWRKAPPPGEKRLWLGLRDLASKVDYDRALRAQDAIQEIAPWGRGVGG